MPYVTQADLVERFGGRELAQLTDETAAQTIDAAEVTKACTEASDLIDAYLGARYTVPLSPVPALVRKWAADIARKFIWKERAGVDSVVTANHDAAIVQIKDVVRKLANLPDVGGVPAVPGAGGYAATAPVAGFDTTGLV